MVPQTPSPATAPQSSRPAAAPYSASSSGWSTQVAAGGGKGGLGGRRGEARRSSQQSQVAGHASTASAQIFGHRLKVFAKPQLTSSVPSSR